MSTTDNPFRGTDKERVRCLGCHETDGLTRRCNEGHGDAAKPRDFQRMVDWRKECSHEECQQYFDALEAAGVIDR